MENEKDMMISYKKALDNCDRSIRRDDDGNIFNTSIALAIVFDMPKEDTLKDIMDFRKTKVRNPLEDAVDEMCTCGHKKSSHKDNVYDGAVAKGHGSCRICDCKRFTWKEFVY